MNDKRKAFELFVNPVFIETGSWKGDGIQKALDCGYGKVISIELHINLYTHCLERFKDDKRVALVHGDSLEVLPTILQGIDQKCTFFLDAHYGDRHTGRGRKDCPVIEELKAIEEHTKRTGIVHDILIDDMRLFRKTHQNVALDDIIKAVKNIYNYYISYTDGYRERDILVATKK